MGYQESFIPIIQLAEAAGLKDAILNRRDDFYFYYYCAARAKKDMYPERWWIGAPESYYQTPLIREGELFAVIGGDRSPCQRGILFTDYIAGLESGTYNDFFDALDDLVVEADAATNPVVREKARTKMEAHLDWCWEDLTGEKPNERDYDYINTLA